MKFAKGYLKMDSMVSVIHKLQMHLENIDNKTKLSLSMQNVQYLIVLNDKAYITPYMNDIPKYGNVGKLHLSLAY